MRVVFHPQPPSLLARKVAFCNAARSSKAFLSWEELVLTMPPTKPIIADTPRTLDNVAGWAETAVGEGATVP